MGKPKDNVLRELAIHHYCEGLCVKEILSLLANRVQRRTVYQWVKEYKDSGKKNHFIQTGRRRTATTHSKKAVVKRLSKKMSGRALAKKINVSQTSVVKMLKEMGLKVIYNLSIFF